jgi:uncharacterized membrane protein YidH (DUF202 family)
VDGIVVGFVAILAFALAVATGVAIARGPSLDAIGDTLDDAERAAAGMPGATAGPHLDARMRLDALLIGLGPALIVLGVVWGAPVVRPSVRRARGPNAWTQWSVSIVLVLIGLVVLIAVVVILPALIL